jgi:hypothetical protein
VRRAFLVRRAASLRRDCALRLRIHRCEPARRLPAHRSAAAPFFTSYAVCISAAIIQTATLSADAAPPSGAASAPLVHEVPSVVGLVCHSAISRRDNYQVMTSQHADGTVRAVFSSDNSGGVVFEPSGAQASGRNFRTRTSVPKLWITSFHSFV